LELKPQAKWLNSRSVHCTVHHSTGKSDWEPARRMVQSERSERKIR